MVFLFMKSSTLIIALFLFTADARAGVLAQFKMSAKLGGTIDVELYDLDKPVTVSNFVAYVKAGLWHDTVLNRWVQDFFIQGGYYNDPHNPELLSLFDPQPQ